MPKKNIEILKAQAYVHELKCVTSLFKRLFELPDNSIAFDEYEKEGMIDQLDQAADRLERLDQKLEEMKVANPECDVIVDGKNIVHIHAKNHGTHEKQGVSQYSGNGNGNRYAGLQDMPNMQPDPDMQA